jgi:hypothetical protein
MPPSDLSRRQVPFGGHQLAEYTLAAALVAVGVHLNGRPEFVLIAGGGAVGALSLVTKAPLAAARLLPKRLHLHLDLVLAAGFAVSPVFYLHNLQVIPIILCEAVAVLLVRMSFTTEIVPPPRPERIGPPSRAARLGALLSQRGASGRRAPVGTAAPGSPSTTGAAEEKAPGSDRVASAVTSTSASRADAAAAVAATAGRVVGTAVAKARNSGAPSAAARGLGRATGHARRIGRAARSARSVPGGSQGVPPGPETRSD